MIVYGEALQRTSRSADSKNANRQRGATDFGSCATPSSRGHHPALSDGRANTSNPTALAASIRETIQQADSRLPLFGAKTLNEQIDETLVQERIVALLSSLFGIVALLLACVGLYGVMSSLVVQRTHEIGIRMALGAERFRVLRLVLGRGMAIALIGVIAGMAGAVGGTRFMVALLFGVKPTDVQTMLFASLALIGVATFACYLPARRAMRVDPMVALRYE